MPQDRYHYRRKLGHRPVRRTPLCTFAEAWHRFPSWTFTQTTRTPGLARPSSRRSGQGAPGAFPCAWTAARKRQFIEFREEGSAAWIGEIGRPLPSDYLRQQTRASCKVAFSRTRTEELFERYIARAVQGGPYFLDPRLCFVLGKDGGAIVKNVTE